MPIPLKDLRSREVADLPLGAPTILRLDGVLVTDLSTMEEVFVTGPVDLSRYGTVMFSGTSPRTGAAWTRDGIGFHVIHKDGVDADMYYRAVGVRFLQQMRGDLESGAYLTTEYVVTPVGDPPKTTYSIERRPFVAS